MQREQAEQILEQTLSFRQAEHLELSLSGSDSANTRFANNVITQNTSRRNVTLHVTAAFGQKVGSASTNRLDAESLKRVVRRAEQIAQSAAPDTEYLPPVGPSSYAEIDSYDKVAADISPLARAEAVKQAAALCEAESLKMAGHYSAGWSFYAIANSTGVFGYHRSSSLDYTSSVMSEDSSGWARSNGYRLSDVTPTGTTGIALQKALAARQPKAVEPGDYRVILEPAAVAEFLSYLFYSMDAKAAHEGRSAFTGKEGTQIGVPELQMYSDPAHPECPSSPFFSNGIPTHQVDWVRDGVLETLSYGRFWAEHTGHPYTGGPTNLIIPGSDASLEGLIASMDQGLLITRFWYIRFVDPMKLLLTGMTRDGLFLIEDGAVRHGIKNLRFNESPLSVLSHIEQFGTPERTQGGCYVPPLKVSKFTFTSGTSF